MNSNFSFYVYFLFTISGYIISQIIIECILHLISICLLLNMENMLFKLMNYLNLYRYKYYY